MALVTLHHQACSSLSYTHAEVDFAVPWFSGTLYLPVTWIYVEAILGVDGQQQKLDQVDEKPVG
jgi:hypothetical protein